MVSHKDVNYVTKNTARCNYTPYIMYARPGGVAVKRHTVCRKEKSVTESHRKRADAKEASNRTRAQAAYSSCVWTRTGLSR